jgi:D-3-phosphoglycerate dehydrogenase / 2-oxoglutarate reductase
MKKRVLLPQAVEKEAVALLESAGFEVILSPDKKPETVAPLLKGIQGVVLRTGIVFSRELMSQADDLWVVARTGAGVDNVDVPAATDLGILVTSVPGANTYSVVEHALTLMLALAKQIPLMDRSVRQDQYDVRFKNYPRDLRGKTLGLIGTGRIGSELARVCHGGLGMKILGHDPYLPPAVKAKLEGWIEFAEMERVFREADVISLHIPSLPSTKKMIGARELGWMKPSAFLLNTSRGTVVDEEALIACLQKKGIAGAGLDVQAEEPPAKDSPLKALVNVILTPHTAALTAECVVRLATGAAECVVDVLSGRKPKEGIVNPDVLSKPRWKGVLAG